MIKYSDQDAGKKYLKNDICKCSLSDVKIYRDVCIYVNIVIALISFQPQENLLSFLSCKICKLLKTNRWIENGYRQ